VDGNKCPIHLIVLEREKEDNWFFKLSAFQEPLEKLYAERPEWVTPQSRYNEALSFIKQGLNDVSLSRRRLRWGVPVPWDESQVIYVWIDALLNYYTALSYAREGEDLTDRYWPAQHLIGKDILKFHAVIWPAMLMAAGIEVPKSIFIHGYLLMDEHKMSKSIGNVIDPFEVMDRFGTDTLRYYLFREVNFGQDGSISAAGFETRYNAELANEFGNLASRTLTMVGRFRDGVVPDASADEELAAELAGVHERVREKLDAVDVSGALEEIWTAVRRLNRYVQDEEPWKLAKDDGASERLDTVLYSLAEGLRFLSVLVHPYMPDSSERLLAALGQDDLSYDGAAFGARPGGAGTGKLDPLFPRIEPPAAAA
jgi:methionyl-tRNA synthetase